MTLNLIASSEVTVMSQTTSIRGGLTVMSISGSLARPDLLLPSRRLADTTLLTTGLRPLALPDVDWMGALKQATSSFNVTLLYDVYENFFGTDLVDPVDRGGIL